MSRGDHVTVAPKAYPLERWPGVIRRRTKFGYSVQYICHGAQFTETFSAGEISADA